MTKAFLTPETEPQRLYRGPLGSSSQIPSHGKVPLTWLLAKLVQLYKSYRRALCKPYVCTFLLVREQKTCYGYRLSWLLLDLFGLEPGIEYKEHVLG